MVKLKINPVNKKGNFFDYSILAKARNEHLGEYALPMDSKLKEIHNIFTKNNYIPVDITGKIYSEIPTISGVPILCPKIIIFGGFEYHCWSIQDNKVLPLFKELINKTLIDRVLSYGDDSSAVEEIKIIRGYCKENGVSFEFNDINGLQDKIRNLKRLDYETSVKVHNQKNLSEDEISRCWEIISSSANGVYNLFKKRAEHCSKEIEKRLNDFNVIVQLLSLEEVANAPYIAEELSKRDIPFVSYILNDVPH